MTKPIRTLGCVMVEPIIWTNSSGELTEAFISEFPQGSTVYKLPCEGGKCITFAATENGNLDGSEYMAIPTGAKKLYIPDLKNLERIYFV